MNKLCVYFLIVLLFFRKEGANPQRLQWNKPERFDSKVDQKPSSK